MIERPTPLDADVPARAGYSATDEVKREVPMLDNKPASFASEKFLSDLDLAFKLSLEHQAGIDPKTMEVLNPHERTRNGETPVGLWNVDSFRDGILSLKVPEEDLESGDIRCAKELRRLFAYMSLSRRKYIDPSPFLNTLIDKEGKCVHQGFQEDPTEFRMLFLEKVKESMEAILQQSKDDDEGEEDLFDLEEEEKEKEKEKDVSLIDKLFSGTFEQTITGVERDGSAMESKQENSFTEIILDINAGGRNIYESLDSFTEVAEIEDFETALGFKTNAKKIVAIKSLPTVLTFQLQRVDYDAQTNKLVKNHSLFSFPKILYAERYLSSNIQNSMETRQMIQNWTLQKNHFEQLLKSYGSYDDSELSVDTILSSAIEILRTQVHVPVEHIETLQRCLDSSVKHKQDFLSQIQRITSTIGHAYSDVDNIGYRLHSLLVHGGKEAGGGHYWAFIYDTDHDRWFKFNDSHVMVVEEDIVFKESEGGNGNESAYCLTYLHPDLHSGPQSIEKGSRNLAPELQIEVAEDNEIHAEEIAKWDRGEREIPKEPSLPSYIPPDPGYMAPSYIQNDDSTSVHFDDGLYNTFSMTQHRIELFKQKYMHEINMIECGVYPVFGVDLRNFSFFLCSINEIQLMQHEVAVTVLQKYFHLSPESPEAARIPLLNALRHQVDTIALTNWHTVFIQNLNAWTFFYQALYHFSVENFGEALQNFYYAYVDSSVIDAPIACKAPEIMNYLMNAILVISRRGSGKWNICERDRDSCYSAFLIASHLKPVQPDLYKELSALWFPILKEQSKYEPDIQIFLSKMKDLYDDEKKKEAVPIPRIFKDLRANWQSVAYLHESVLEQQHLLIATSYSPSL